MKFIKYDGLWYKFIELNSSKNKIVIEDYCSKISLIDNFNYQIVECNDWRLLDWKDTRLVDNSYQTGWLSPDGNFFGCAYYLHSLQAEFILKKTEVELENEGWCRISNDYLTDKPIILFNFKDYTRKPTSEQIHFLKAFGYDIYDLMKECLLVDENNMER